MSEERVASRRSGSRRTAIRPWCGCRIVRSTRLPASQRSPGSRRSRATTASTSSRWRSRLGHRKNRSPSGCATSRTRPFATLRACRQSFSSHPGPEGRRRQVRRRQACCARVAEHGVDLRHDGGALADGGRDPLGRAGAHVADREHARPCWSRAAAAARRIGSAPLAKPSPVTTKPLSSTATQFCSQPAFGSAPMNRNRWRSGQVVGVAARAVAEHRGRSAPGRGRPPAPTTSACRCAARHWAAPRCGRSDSATSSPRARAGARSGAGA